MFKKFDFKKQNFLLVDKAIQIFYFMVRIYQIHLQFAHAKINLMFNTVWAIKKVVATIRHDNLRKLTTSIVVEVSKVMETEPNLAPLFGKELNTSSAIFRTLPNIYDEAFSR